jgi:hypothetical protein
METQSKSIFFSVTFWGGILSGLLVVIDHLTGVKLDDQVGPLARSIVELVQALLAALPTFTLPLAHFVAVITVIYGRFTAKQPVHLFAPAPPGGSTPPPQSPLLKLAFIFLVCGSALGLGGCATTGTTAPPLGTAAATSGTAAPTLTQTITADLKGATNDALSFANALQKMNDGNLLPPAAVTTVLALTHNSGDASTAAALNNLLGQVVAAKALATTPAQSISNVNQVLAPLNVQSTVQAVTAPAPIPPPPPPTPPSTSGNGSHGSDGTDVVYSF